MKNFLSLIKNGLYKFDENILIAIHKRTIGSNSILDKEFERILYGLFTLLLGVFGYIITKTI